MKMLLLPPQDETLGDTAKMLWRARFYLAVGAFTGLLAAFFFLEAAVPHYKAQMIVAPANPMNGAEVSSMLNDDNPFTLRYMVQREGNSSSADFLRFENMVRGPSVAAELFKREDVRRGLAADRAFRFMDADQEWSAAKFADYIAKRVKLEPLGATSLRKVIYFHADPVFAAHFLTLLQGAVDSIIRRSVREEAEKRVQYLKNAVVTTNNPEHKRALTALLLEQERMRMLVSIDQPYAAALVEPAAASYRPAWPDRTLMLLAFVLGGGLMGFVIYAFRNAEPH